MLRSLACGDSHSHGPNNKKDTRPFPRVKKREQKEPPGSRTTKNGRRAADAGTRPAAARCVMLSAISPPTKSCARSHVLLRRALRVCFLSYELEQRPRVSFLSRTRVSFSREADAVFHLVPRCASNIVRFCKGAHVFFFLRGSRRHTVCASLLCEEA